MSEIVNHSLHKVAKGTGIILLGTIAAMGFGFLGRILLARFFTQSEYGIYSLALVVLSIAVAISFFGLQEGTTRQIAYYRGKGDKPRVQGVITSSLQITLVASILLAVILLFTSGIISTKIFHEPGLATPLKIIAIALPFFVLTQVFAHIFRGFDEVKPSVYFQSILRSGLFPLLLLPIVLVGLPFLGAMYAFLASIILACIVFAAYTKKKAPVTIERGEYLAINPVGKELLLLSLPLFGAAMLAQIMNWTDTLMLGYFLPSDIVGLYNGAQPLAYLIPIIVTSAGFIYVPIASYLYAREELTELSRTYKVLTKWLSSVSFPIFLVLFVFPKPVLSFFFGPEYVEAAPVLQILAFGFMFQNFFGLTGMTVISMGKTRVALAATSIGAVSNIILNVVLIPLYGAIGAAIASAATLCLANIFTSVMLYHYSRIHPFTKGYLKSVGCSVAILVLIYVLVSFIEVQLWMVPLFVIVFLVVYLILLLLTKSFAQEDISMLLALEKRAGVDLKLLKRVIKKFL